MGTTGEFWYLDYYGRFIWDEEHFKRATEYIEMNPVKAGSCRRREDCPLGSTWPLWSNGCSPLETKPSAARMAALPGEKASVTLLFWGNDSTPSSPSLLSSPTPSEASLSFTQHGT